MMGGIGIWIAFMICNLIMINDVLPTPYNFLTKAVYSFIIALGPIGTVSLLLASPFL